MNRTIDALMNHLKGSMEEGRYIAEVSENLYSMTVENFFSGRKDAEDSISFLYGLSHDDPVKDIDMDLLEKRFAYEQMKAEKRFRKTHSGSGNEISEYDHDHNHEYEDEEEEIFDPEQSGLKTQKKIFRENRFGDALLIGKDLGGIRKETFKTFCCLISDMYRLPSRMKKQKSI